MFRPKYKLVCTVDYQDYKAGDIVTTADMPTHFGGPWGWIQDAGCAEWQENLPTAEEILADAKLEKQSILKSALSATDYKTLKYTDGDITADEYAPIKTYRKALRDAYRAIEVAGTVAEVEAVTIP